MLQCSMKAAQRQASRDARKRVSRPDLLGAKLAAEEVPDRGDHRRAAGNEDGVDALNCRRSVDEKPAHALVQRVYLRIDDPVEFIARDRFTDVDLGVVK